MGRVAKALNGNRSDRRGNIRFVWLLRPQKGPKMSTHRDYPAGDQELVRAIASNFARRLGAEALEELRQRASLAAEKGDLLSEQAWRDIADAADGILRANRELVSVRRRFAAGR
jgi:hypothetical protein